MEIIEPMDIRDFELAEGGAEAPEWRYGMSRGYNCVQACNVLRNAESHDILIMS